MHLIIAGTEFVLYVGLLHRDYHLPLHLQLSSEDLGQGPPAVFSYITKLLMVMVVMEVVVMMVVMMMVVTMMVVMMMVVMMNVSPPRGKLFLSSLMGESHRSS